MTKKKLEKIKKKLASPDYMAKAMNHVADVLADIFLPPDKENLHLLNSPFKRRAAGGPVCQRAFYSALDGRGRVTTGHTEIVCHIESRALGELHDRIASTRKEIFALRGIQNRQLDKQVSRILQEFNNMVALIGGNTHMIIVPDQDGIA